MPACHMPPALLPPCALAGKTFFKKKKQPVPVRLTGKDWAAQIRKACEATYLFWSGELRGCVWRAFVMWCGGGVWGAPPHRRC